MWVLFFARSFVFVFKYLLLFLLVSVLTSAVGILCSLCKNRNPPYLSICVIKESLFSNKPYITMVEKLHVRMQRLFCTSLAAHVFWISTLNFKTTQHHKHNA